MVKLIGSEDTSIHYCSVISKVNGEDPIGSAGTADHWILIEVAKPWSANLWREDTTMRAVFERLKALEKAKQWTASLRVLAIAPEPEYSTPGRTRVIYYKRPHQLFAQYEKHEYLVPQEQVITLVNALLSSPDGGKTFAGDRQDTSHIRELLICTHAEIDKACGQFGIPVYEKLRHLAADSYASGDSPVRVWQSCHFGGHKFAPTLIDFPHGHFWGHLEPEMLNALVDRTGSVMALRPFYRGWAGLGQFEQIAERDIWSREGWAWLTYAKTGRVVTLETKPSVWPRSLLNWMPNTLIRRVLGRSQSVNWVDVEIEFVSPDGDRTGTYDVRVIPAGEVITAPKSGATIALKAVKQYKIQHCVLR